jgi:hypothetical protein
MWRFICMLGSVAIALALVGSASAFAANAPSSQTRAQTKAQWQEEIANLRTPGRGCYHASYPSLQWHTTRCLVAPNVPLAPRLQTRGGPSVVGNGADYSAQVTGTISEATGTFKHVTSSLTEKGKVGGVGSQVNNAFSLQLNTEFFSTPMCSGSADPADCLGWQQFVYAFHYSGHTNMVFMQYWLLYYDTTCPAGWITYDTDGYIFCYINSSASSYGSLPANELGEVALVGQASSGGNDQVSLTNTSTGQTSSISNSDSELDLSAAWNTTEWGVFGDAGGGQANFGTDSTLEPVTTLHGTSSSPPTCVSEGFTGETNNLSFTKTKALGTESSPTMATKETNGTIKTPSCEVAG